MDKVIMIIFVMHHVIILFSYTSEGKVFPINVCSINENRENSSVVNSTFELPFELRPDGYFGPNITLLFRGMKHKPNCSMGSFTIIWKKSEENIIRDTDEYRIKMPDLIISPDGYIRYKNQVYEEGQYCLLNQNETQVQFEVCTRICDEKNPCVYKCCEPDEVMDIQRFPSSVCHPSEKDRWRPALYMDENSRLSSEDSKNIKPALHFRHPKSFMDKCKLLETLSLQDIGQKLQSNYNKHTIFRMLQNGSIVELDEKKEWKLLANDFYCVDGSHNFSTDSNYISGSEDLNTILIRCDLKDPEVVILEEKKQSVDIFYGIVLVICSGFLLTTLIVYIILWKTHNVHVLTQLCYIFSLLCAYVFLATTRFTSVLWTRTNVVSNSCRIIGILSHFFYLSTFTWLSVVNFDIWLTFRNLRPTGGENRGLKKLVAYCVFAEGIPFIIVAVAVVLDSVYDDDIKNSVILPQYGRKNCFLDLYFAQLYYLYIPIGILLSVNLLFFILTVHSLYYIRQSTKIATTSSSKSSSPNESLKLFTKLFIIMGIPWIFDVLSWLTTTDYHDAKWYWVIADILLICQSFAFFSFFVMKKDICRALDAKFPRFKTFKEQLTEVFSNAMSPFSSLRNCPCLTTKDNFSEPSTASTYDHPNSNMNSVELNTYSKEKL